jgi:hypothetical protein
MTTPPTINWANRISSDVFIRDCDDPTAQMRAQVFDINYDTKEAEVGFYPERGVKFSMLHLPDIYRATIPLADLSLDPLSGAAEFGYADIIRRGDKDVDLSYLDWTGVTRVPVIATDDDGQPAAAVPRVATHLHDAQGVYVCPQCGKDPNGDEIHAMTHHTLPPWSVEEAKAEIARESREALPEFTPSSAGDTLVPDPPAHRENPNMGIGFVGLGKPPFALTLNDVDGVQRAGGTAPLFTREEVHRKATQVIDWMKDELRKLEEMIKSME